jgi:hypothetical protein
MAKLQVQDLTFNAWLGLLLLDVSTSRFLEREARSLAFLVSAHAT